jgi:glycosyltransferase involved in cell wall biosynthesis
MITGSIITLNESRRIVDCIESLWQVCDEILVIDSLSTDDTADLARAHGARVIEQPYLGDGPQRNVAIEHARNDWILSLDADERITPELAEEIKGLDLVASTEAAYATKRRNYVGSRWIKRCGWYPDYVVRLYHRRRTRHGEGVFHQSDLPVENPCRLENDMVHLSFDNLGQLFAKPDRDYPKRAAKALYRQGKRANAFAPVSHGLAAFGKHYLLKLGIIEGFDGLTVSLSRGMASYLKYAWLLDFQRDPKVREAEDFDSIW